MRENERPLMARRLAESRNRAQLTTRQVAGQLGITQSYITNLETGRNQPNSWKLLRDLCVAYQVSPAYVLGISDDVGGEATGEIEALYYQLSDKSKREMLRMVRHLLLQESAEYRAAIFEELVAGDPIARAALTTLLQQDTQTVDPAVLTLLQQCN